MTTSLFQQVRNSFLLSWEGLFPGTILIGNARPLVKKGDGMTGEETLIAIVDSASPKKNLVSLRYAYKTQDGVWKKNQRIDVTTLSSLEKLVKNNKLTFANNRQKTQYQDMVAKDYGSL